MRVTALGLLVGTLISTNAFAQTTAQEDDAKILRAAVTVVALVSAQPIDSTWVDPTAPYLDKGLGGLTPGLTIGLNVSVKRHVIAIAEFSTSATIRRFQRGRNVNGQAVGELRDAFLSVLAGLTTRSRKKQIDVVAGFSRAFGAPTLNDVPISQRGSGYLDPAALDGARALAPTTGIGVAAPITRRVNLVSSFRYTYLSRSRRAVEMGVGNHVFRAGAGLMFRLSK